MLLSSADFFQNIFFQKTLSGTLFTVSNGLDPDQDLQSVHPDLGSNCLQRLFTDEARSYSIRITDLIFVMQCKCLF